MTNPDSPRFMWVIDNATPGFEQLALTFSTPRVARLDLGEAAPSPVLVFAGGYNGGWQGAGRVGKDAGADRDLTGNAVYVVDPADGGLIWRAQGPNGGAAPDQDEQLLFVADLADSIPSPVTVIDSDHNGVDDRAYVGDSGGNVWRIEFTEFEQRKPDTAVTDASNWYLTRLATLGGAGESGRRFFHAPDVVQSRDAVGAYDGVVILSGNRAAPRETVVQDFAYLLKDRRASGHANDPAAAATPAIGHERLADITDACAAAAAIQCSEADLATGWKLRLAAPGEKGLSTPLVSNGRVLFTTYVPTAGDTPDGDPENGALSCAAAEGYGQLYGVTLRNGSPALTPAGKLDLTPGEEQDLERALSIGPGLHGDVVPVGGKVLIPGGGLAQGALAQLSGRTWWRSYWREDEVDTL
jgi:type IV pilus assembly protein PilY1